MCLVLGGVRLCDPMGCNLPGSSLDRILQARILELVTISFSRDLPHLGIKPKSLSSALQERREGKPQQIKAHLFEGEGRHIALNHNSVIDTDDR